MYTRDQIEQMIYSYRWRKNILIDEGYITDSNGTAQYGIEATMPKGQGSTSNKVLNIVARNDVLHRVLYEHIEVIEFIDKYEHKIDNDMNLNILFQIKQGKKDNKVMKLMNIGRDNYNGRINDIVNVYYKQQEQQQSQEKPKQQQQRKQRKQQHQQQKQEQH